MPSPFNEKEIDAVCDAIESATCENDVQIALRKLSLEPGDAFDDLERIVLAAYNVTPADNAVWLRKRN